RVAGDAWGQAEEAAAETRACLDPAAITRLDHLPSARPRERRSAQGPGRQRLPGWRRPARQQAHRQRYVIGHSGAARQGAAAPRARPRRPRQSATGRPMAVGLRLSRSDQRSGVASILAITWPAELPEAPFAPQASRLAGRCITACLTESQSVWAA